jgi:two-component system, NarL family, response regulator NreC
MARVDVFIADDHPVVRDGLRFTIERSGGDIAVVGEADNGRGVLACVGTLHVDVYILDVTMPELNGIDTARLLLAANPEARILMLSFHDSKAIVEAALRGGAHGFILKESATQDIVEAIRAVMRGDCYLSPSLVDIVRRGPAGRYVASGSLPGQELTARERETLQLIAEGLTSREIAGRLAVSVNTVRVHRRRLMAKLDVHKGTDLVRHAAQRGMIQI